MTLQSLHIQEYKTNSGYVYDLEVTYQLFGPALGTAPVVLVNHALTGNSQVTGAKGWWQDLIGDEKTIDTQQFTILAINIPGNGYDRKQHNLIDNYKHFNNSDIAAIYYTVIQQLHIESIYAVIGGSLGGQIAWELVIQQPKLVKHLIPVASDWKATDWVIACCYIQDQILNNSVRPIEDARAHAMTFYRTATSFKKKFERSRNQKLDMYNVASWLQHHGNRLKERFNLQSYKLMNHLLGTSDCTRGTNNILEALKEVSTHIHLIAIDSDQLFYADEIRETYALLKENNHPVSYGEINSIDGHDAFLIEFKQLERLVKPIFQNIPSLQ